MAIKWADADFTKTALDARMKYEVSGGWWFTGDDDRGYNEWICGYASDRNYTLI
jgi:hypothetical protein